MLDSRLLARLEHKKARLDALRPLPAAAVAHLKEQITVEWIYNSNAIEGSTLTLRETQLILETGLTIGGKSLREHFEVINHKDAIEYVENLSERGVSLSAFHVCQIHQRKYTFWKRLEWSNLKIAFLWLRNCNSTSTSAKPPLAILRRNLRWSGYETLDDPAGGLDSHRGGRRGRLPGLCVQPHERQ